MKAIPFFTDDITLAVHTATDAAHIGQHVTLWQFAHGERLGLYELKNGELLARTLDGKFIEGIWL